MNTDIRYSQQDASSHQEDEVMGKQALLDGITKEPKDVYSVWTRTGHRPRYAHSTRQRAVAEAQRLALLNPGKKFIVMHCLGKYSASSAAGAEAETAQAVTA